MSESYLERKDEGNATDMLHSYPPYRFNPYKYFLRSHVPLHELEYMEDGRPW